jgi:hypothetical protein
VEAPIVLDPGSHTIELVAAGRQTQTRSLVLREGQGTEKLKVGPVLGDAPPPRGLSPDPPTSDDRGRRTLGFVVGGVGLAAVAAGATFGLLALSKKSDADASCQGRYDCPRDGYDANNAAHTDAAVSTIAFAVGLVAAGVGTYLVVTSRSSGKASASLGLVPLPGGGALHLGARF